MPCRSFAGPKRTLQHILRKVRCGFFAMSRSIFRRATSALKRASSICSAVTTGAFWLGTTPPNCPLASRRTQLDTFDDGMPSTLATTAPDCPALTCLTASSLYSRVYLPRTCLSTISSLLSSIVVMS